LSFAGKGRTWSGEYPDSAERGGLKEEMCVKAKEQNLLRKAVEPDNMLRAAELAVGNKCAPGIDHIAVNELLSHLYAKLCIKVELDLIWKVAGLGLS
jgi:hypothetical protein